MDNLIKKVKALEEKYRGGGAPIPPRAWASRILSGVTTLDEVPEHFRGIVAEHLETHRIFTYAAAKRILELPNGKARLEAFNKLAEEVRGPVKKAALDMKVLSTL